MSHLLTTYPLAARRLFASAVAFLVIATATSSTIAAEQKFDVKPIAEKTISQLPAGQLFWRVETFPTLAQAQAAATPTALAAEVAGKAWLFTLGSKDGASPGATKVTEVGPVAPFTAPEYLLRVVSSGGPPGAQTLVHQHPGSESFYILTGELTQKTPHGVSHVGAGQSMPGHGPGLPMQVSSTGNTDLHALVMFVMDATKPFSSPATMPAAAVSPEATPPNSAEARRIKSLVEKAAELVNAEGKDAFTDFRKRGSEWFSGDTYIFAYAPDGVVLLNPAFPSREGRAYHGETDKKGKAFHDVIVKTAQTQGSGWVDYWLPKPGQTEPSQKWSYVEAVKAEGVAVVGAGFFPK